MISGFCEAPEARKTIQGRIEHATYKLMAATCQYRCKGALPQKLITLDSVADFIKLKVIRNPLSFLVLLCGIKTFEARPCAGWPAR